jgi:outer membrane protein assembly factor BamB
VLLALLWLVAVAVVRGREELPFQQRNLATLMLTLVTGLLLLGWWLGFSRAPARWRWAGVGALVLLIAGFQAAFRIRGVSGDLVPILEPRWQTKPTAAMPDLAPAVPSPAAAPAFAGEFRQFLGPDRDGRLPGPRLATNWGVTPPVVRWRQPIGPAWSGFSVAAGLAVTQEQRGEEELVTAYDLATGQPRWTHADAARYATTIAGEGPRCSPTIVGDRVYALGATGVLNCLELATGRRVWRRRLLEEGARGVPEWGFSGSPLVTGGMVIVSAGGDAGKSLHAYDAATGEPRWRGGDEAVSFGSPAVATLAGVPHVLTFNARSFTAHDPATGRVLWRHPFGVGYPLVAMPIVLAPDRVLITAGYGVGAELLRVTVTNGAPAATSLWVSKKLKAKFANPVRAGDFVYGLDDSILACLDVRDGSQRWKEGRYGHGQGLLVGSRYLLLAESGELVLLEPTPDAPRELARRPVFTAKTWNPIALAGDLLLVRNDQEAACLRLPLEP